MGLRLAFAPLAVHVADQLVLIAKYAARSEHLGTAGVERLSECPIISLGGQQRYGQTQPFGRGRRLRPHPPFDRRQRYRRRGRSGLYDAGPGRDLLSRLPRRRVRYLGIVAVELYGQDSAEG